MPLPTPVDEQPGQRFTVRTVNSEWFNDVAPLYATNLDHALTQARRRVRHYPDHATFVFSLRGPGTILFHHNPA